MAMTVNNLGTLTLLNILDRTQSAQDKVMNQMSTGSMINRGADDPAGLLALTKLNQELTAVDTGIQNNQRTDAMLGVADNALAEVENLISEIQRLANETTNDAALTTDEIVANQTQIDDALASIDRIVNSTNFNGKKLIDGSLAVNYTNGDTTKITDVRVYSRTTGSSTESLSVQMTNSATNAIVSQVATSGDLGNAATTSFTVQGKLGTAVIEVASSDTVADWVTKINAAAGQTGISASDGGSSSGLVLASKETGSEAFVRTTYISGDTSFTNSNDTGSDAEVTINGMKAAVDGNSVNYSGNGVNVSFELTSAMDGTAVTLQIHGDANGASGATFNLGTNNNTRATIGIAGMYTHNLGTASVGYLASLGSGKGNSLLTDPDQAAEIARESAKQVSQLRGRIGGFQKFQVRTAINSLSDNKEGLEKARSVINDVDYAVASSELNRQNVLLQSAMSLLGLANQQSSQVLSLLR